VRAPNCESRSAYGPHSRHHLGGSDGEAEAGRAQFRGAPGAPCCGIHCNGVPVAGLAKVAMNAPTYGIVYRG